VAEIQIGDHQRFLSALVGELLGSKVGGLGLQRPEGGRVEVGPDTATRVEDAATANQQESPQSP
jgi:hypothetical protein